MELYDVPHSSPVAHMGIITTSPSPNVDSAHHRLISYTRAKLTAQVAVSLSVAKSSSLSARHQPKSLGGKE